MRVNITPARSLLVARDAPFTQLQRVFFLLLALMWKCMMFELKRNTKIIIQRTHLFKPYLYQKILLQKLRIYSVLHQRIHPEIIIEARTKICRHRYIYRMTLDSAMSCFYSVGKEKLKLLNLYLIFSVTNFPRDPKLTNVWLVFVKKVYQKKFMRNLRA